MYSILLSDISLGFENAISELKKIINSNMKVAIFPWAYPIEINSDILNNEYFKKGEKRYNKYVTKLEELGIKEDNIVVCDCYKDSTQKLKRIINNSDILLFPGGNPEMLFYNILHRTEILYSLKKYNKIIIGESAGAVMQFERYFATAENNYYNYFAFYDGYGIINDTFYIDVHTINNKKYLSVLKEITDKMKKDIYAIPNDGCLIYDREKQKIVYKNNIIEIKCSG